MSFEIGSQSACSFVSTGTILLDNAIDLSPSVVIQGITSASETSANTQALVMAEVAVQSKVVQTPRQIHPAGRAGLGDVAAQEISLAVILTLERVCRHTVAAIQRRVLRSVVTG